MSDTTDYIDASKFENWLSKGTPAEFWAAIIERLNPPSIVGSDPKMPNSPVPDNPLVAHID